jgi:hypothetical protein
MPSEYSLYRKIQVALDIAKSVQISAWSQLKEKIASEAPPNFMTTQYDVKRDAMVQQLSERSIRRTVNICRALHLIDDSGDLTSTGRKSLRHASFNKILAEAVREFLEGRNVNISNLNEIIQKSLRARPVVMPTAIQLWEASRTEMPLLLFSQMLTLLSQCGGADSSQRKIYLEFTRDGR